ncbi:30S ribosomal protein S2 [Patescibacteria group bacterium]|nr:30S ribosomal protein S2 [Patescibacteria group bacterium]
MPAETLTEEQIAEIAKTGLFYGHKKTVTHPKMKPFLGGRRNEIEIIDPEQTMKSLGKAIEFIKGVVSQGGLVLWVGTKPAAKAAVKGIADELKAPYVTFRWLGGILTNFKVISARLNYFLDLKAKQAKGELSKYTKKEQLEFAKEVQKMTRIFDGLAPLTRLPAALFIVDAKEHETAVREARRLKIPVVAVIDSNDDPTLVDHPIFGNDHAKASIEWIVERIREGIK